MEFVVGGHRRALAAMALTAYLGGVAEALFLVTVTRAAFAITDGDDQIGIVAGRYLTVNQTLLVALGLVVARMAFASLAAWQSAIAATAAVARIRRRVATAFLHTSWKVQQSQRAGSLQELLSGYASHANVLMNALNQGVVSGANLIALIGIAVAVDPVGALVLVFSVAGLGLLLRPLRGAVRRRAHAATAAGMEFATAVNDVSDLGMELHVFHVQHAAGQVIEGLIDRAKERARRLQFASGLSTPVYTGLAYLALVGALAIVALSSSASLASLGAAMLVMLRSLTYAQALQSSYTSISASVPAIQELEQRALLFEANRSPMGGEPADKIERVTAERVTFAYVEGQEVLRDISFTLEACEVVGIVGPSGGGKSTLIQLLLGLRSPDQGRILVNDRDLTRIDRSQLARRITFVPQAVHLIAGTIAENIRFFRDGVTQVEIERAARLAHLHDEIDAFPEGYERQVGEHGGHLSGGQQQRLCIARALVEDPDVLVMDEPTSALDVRSEHLIRTTLLGLKERMTVVVIAHRLSTLDICDRIMVIQEGELRGFDAPGVLEETSDFYREALVLSGLR